MSVRLLKRAARAAVAAAAVTMLGTLPLSAGGAHIASICTQGGARLVLLDGPSPARRKNDPQPGGCAHATCPRQSKPQRKGRSHP